MKVPIASLALARCPLPPRRARSDLMSRHGGLKGGAAIKCVVAVGADSSVGLLDAGSGFCLSK
jgi:hypothetical protein